MRNINVLVLVLKELRQKMAKRLRNILQRYAKVPRRSCTKTVLAAPHGEPFDKYFFLCSKLPNIMEA